MATMKKPVVYDDANNTLAPIADGQVLEPSAIPVSATEGNVVKLEEDGLVVTPSSLVSEASDNLLKVQDGKLLVKAPTTFDHVSEDEGNLLRNGSDGLAYVDGNDLLSNGDVNLLTINETDKKIILTKDAIIKQVASDLVSEDDGILKAVDGQIVSEVCVNYEPLTGMLQLTGVDGEIVCETTVPSQATALKSVDFVTTKPDAEGESVSGTYTVSVQLRDALLGWLEPVTVDIEATKGTASEVTIEIDGGGTCGGLPSGMVNARAWFNGQESDIYAGTTAMSFAFADSSVLSFTSYKLNEEGTGYVLTGTFTPAVGVASGAWLHFIFELTDDSISELYVDVSYLIDVYTAGDGIIIEDNEISVDTEWVGEHVTASVKAGDGIEVSEEDNAVSVKAGTGITVDANGTSIDQTWLSQYVNNVSAVSTDADNAVVEGSDKKAYFPADWGTME